jgi:hypothetical protein
MWTKKNYKRFWNKPDKMKVVYGGQLRLTADKRLTSFTQIYPIGQASFIREMFYTIGFIGKGN